MITSNVPNTVCADPAGMTLTYDECANLIRLTFFGVRYVLTYSPNHSSAQDVKHLDHQCDSL